MTHVDCGERLDCPCWKRGAREEAEMHRARTATRELTDYVRALGDTDPAMTTRAIADAVARVFGSAGDKAEAPHVWSGDHGVATGGNIPERTRP